MKLPLWASLNKPLPKRSTRARSSSVSPWRLPWAQWTLERSSLNYSGYTVVPKSILSSNISFVVHSLICLYMLLKSLDHTSPGLKYWFIVKSIAIVRTSSPTSGSLSLPIYHSRWGISIPPPAEHAFDAQYGSELHFVGYYGTWLLIDEG
jgi:hypothetical protein